VQRRVADHQAHLGSVLRQEIFDDRVERAAGLAGWVKKLDDSDRRVGQPKHRRVHAHQPTLFDAVLLVLRGLHAFLVAGHTK
jgi:hypothetical protein